MTEPTTGVEPRAAESEDGDECWSQNILALEEKGVLIHSEEGLMRRLLELQMDASPNAVAAGHLMRHAGNAGVHAPWRHLIRAWDALRAEGRYEDPRCVYCDLGALQLIPVLTYMSVWSGPWLPRKAFMTA